MDLFGEEKDWKEFLSDDARQSLEDLLTRARKHRGAYSKSDDVKLSQIWSVLIELKRDVDEIKKTLGKLEEPWKAIVSVGDAEKKRAIERMVSEIVRPTSEDTQEANKKLVESLMKF